MILCVMLSAFSAPSSIWEMAKLPIISYKPLKCNSKIIPEKDESLKYK